MVGGPYDFTTIVGRQSPRLTRSGLPGVIDVLPTRSREYTRADLHLRDRLLAVLCQHRSVCHETTVIPVDDAVAGTAVLRGLARLSRLRR